ncbi:MAG: FIST C-terminal domain-containing protein [Oleiphilaceae bacterium]|nr:FIST C-terminal domain-containing protein [Oleiphilaceae bacterium]
MRANSATTIASTPYRAGLDLGEALRDTGPEVVFLFSSIHYAGNGDLLEGLYDGIGRDDLIVIGSTGDGFYGSGEVGEMGASALALNSDQQVRWHLTYAKGLGQDSEATTRAVLNQMQSKLGNKKAAFMYMASDFRVDASDIEKVLGKETHVPVVGALAADDNQMISCAVYANREILEDGIALLAAEGPVSFQIHVANALSPIGHAGIINAAEGSHIHQINDVPAMDYIVAETGKPVLHSDRGIASLAIINSDEPDVKRLRSIVPKYSVDEGSLGLYGGIEVGCKVQVCLAEPHRLIEELHKLTADIKVSGFQPAAALLISCVGRKVVLGDQVDQEVGAVSDSFGKTLPLAGCPSFGEIGPMRTATGYSKNLFHNMTYILLLIGKT